MALLPFSSAFAQEGEIIYKDFDPDPYLFFQWSYETLYLDLNFDSIPDMYMAYHLSLDDASWEIVSCQDNFQICVSCEEDTISENNDWTSYLGAHPDPDRLFYGGFRFMVDGHYYYGWYKTYDYHYMTGIHNNYFWCFDKLAYCTIPDHPIVWGQTSITGIGENSESIGFATVHPNPTTGMVSITGENLRKAEVTNMLGQHVATASSQGGQLSVDISRLPAGVYFVSVTDESGKKCVRKVVKE